MDKNKFGTYIREKRLERGYTQKELSDLLMIDVSAVSKWERGVTYPDITVLPELCRHLKVSEHELIASSNDTEARAVMAEARQYRNLKNAVFSSFSVAYAAAVLICFIVNLAVSHTLSWFFIAAASCLCGFTFVPSVLRFFDRNKLSVYLGSTLGGLFLVYLTVSVYTGHYWVWTASVATLLGYFCVFAPILLARQKRYLHEETYHAFKKYMMLIYAVGAFLLTGLLLFCVDKYVPFDLGRALKITVYCYTVLLAWALVELIPISRPTKLGFDSVLTGGYLYGMNGVLNRLLGENGTDYYTVNFSDWEQYSNGNVALIAVCVFAAVGVTLVLTGIFRRRKADNL